MSSHASTHNRGNQVNQGIGGFHIPPSQGSGIAAGGQTGTSGRLEETHAPVTFKPVSEHFHGGSPQQKQKPGQEQQDQQQHEQQPEQHSNQQVQQGVNQGVNQDLNQDLKHDVQQDLKHDLKQELQPDDAPLRHMEQEQRVHRQQQGAESRAEHPVPAQRPRDTGQQMWDQRSAQTRLEDAAAASSSSSSVSGRSSESGSTPDASSTTTSASSNKQATQAQGGGEKEQHSSAVDRGRPQGDDAGAAAAGNAFQ